LDEKKKCDTNIGTYKKKKTSDLASAILGGAAGDDEAGQERGGEMWDVRKMTKGKRGKDSLGCSGSVERGQRNVSEKREQGKKRNKGRSKRGNP